MRIARNLLILTVVAGLGFAAGHARWFNDLEPAAAAQAGEEKRAEGAKEMQGAEGMEAFQAEMEAYMNAGTPGEHHKVLDQLTGKWEGTFTMLMEPNGPSFESTGTASREWVLDGRFIRESVEAASDMGQFKGIGFTGYNNQKGLYEMVWMENMSTGIYNETGYYDPAEKTLHTRGMHLDPATGRVLPTWGKLMLASPDRHEYEGYTVDENGQKFKCFHGVMERVAK